MTDSRSRGPFPPASTASNKMSHTLLMPFRRRSSKTKQDIVIEQQRVEATGPLLRPATTTSHVMTIRESTTRTLSQSLYCPPLAPQPPTPTKRRVRVSGSRLPSGYRPKSPPMSVLTSETDTPPNIALAVQSQSSIRPDALPSQPARITRFARFLHRHSTSLPSASTSVTTPTPSSSIISFPSSSRTVITPSSSSSSTTVSRKKVRFSTSKTQYSPIATKREVTEKERITDVLSRLSSPWRKGSDKP